jgi:hypothetical protein
VSLGFLYISVLRKGRWSSFLATIVMDVVISVVKMLLEVVDFKWSIKPGHRCGVSISEPVVL